MSFTTIFCSKLLSWRYSPLHREYPVQESVASHFVRTEFLALLHICIQFGSRNFMTWWAISRLLHLQHFSSNFHFWKYCFILPKDVRSASGMPFINNCNTKPSNWISYTISLNCSFLYYCHWHVQKCFCYFFAPLQSSVAKTHTCHADALHTHQQRPQAKKVAINSSSTACAVLFTQLLSVACCTMDTVVSHLCTKRNGKCHISGENKSQAMRCTLKICTLHSWNAYEKKEGHKYG